MQPITKLLKVKGLPSLFWVSKACDDQSENVASQGKHICWIHLQGSAEDMDSQMSFQATMMVMSNLYSLTYCCGLYSCDLDKNV